MKFSIIVGHTENDKGVYSPTLGQSEYDWNDDLAKKILKKASNLDVKIFYRNTVGISGAYQKSDQWGANCSIELHFNSNHNLKATGTGVLYLAGSSKGKKLAQHLRAHLKTVLPLPDWPKSTGGVATPFQASGLEERGKKSLSAGRAAAVLVEPFFGSNPSDCSLASQNKDAMAQMYCDAFSAYAKSLL